MADVKADVKADAKEVVQTAEVVAGKGEAELKALAQKLVAEGKKFDDLHSLRQHLGDAVKLTTEEGRTVIRNMRALVADQK